MQGLSRWDTAHEEQPVAVVNPSAAPQQPQKPRESQIRQEQEQQEHQVPTPQALPPVVSQQRQQAGSQRGLVTSVSAAAGGLSAPAGVIAVGRPVPPGPYVPVPAVPGQPPQPQPYLDAAAAAAAAAQRASYPLGSAASPLNLPRAGEAPQQQGAAVRGFKEQVMLWRRLVGEEILVLQKVGAAPAGAVTAG